MYVPSLPDLPTLIIVKKLKIFLQKHNEGLNVALPYSKQLSWTCSISFPLELSGTLNHWCIIFVCYVTSLSCFCFFFLFYLGQLFKDHSNISIHKLISFYFVQIVVDIYLLNALLLFSGRLIPDQLFL